MTLHHNQDHFEQSRTMPRLTAGMLVRIVDTSDVGTLIQIREASQTCVIKLTDGTLKKNVPVDDVKEAKGELSTDLKSPIRLASAALALPPSTSSSAGASGEPRPSPVRRRGSSNRYEVGDAVRARYKRGTKWFEGMITRIRSDGTFDIKYADGDTEAQVDAQYIEPKTGAGLSPVKAPGQSTKPLRLSVGDRVKARYKKGSKLFSGKITKAHDDGTYDVRYDDGDVETRVDIAYIQRDGEDEDPPPSSPKKVSGSGATKRHVAYEAGDRVRARYKKGSKFFNGKITKAHADGTYDVKYEDGDVETRVDSSYIERADSSSDDEQPSRGKAQFHVGDAVRARYKGGAKMYNAKVTKANSDGSYDLRFEDGDVEKSVKADHIQAIDADARASSSKPLSPLKSPSKKQPPPSIGDKVKARYNRGAKFFNGTITQVRSDGTYDIRYEDGDSESRVDTKYIDFLRDESGDADGEKTATKKAPSYHVGEVVQARYKRGKKLYAGKIKRTHSDGTYDIEYEDGDTETRVAIEYIEPSDTVPASSPKKKQPSIELVVGDRVNARYKRGAKMFPGKIQRVRSDGTYDIKYEDGDVETSVALEYIEQQQTSAMEVGDRVQVKAKRGSRMSPGRITKRHSSDGTYDVKYDDGETETHVDSDRLEKADEADRPLQVGDAVKARYKKGKKLYAGTITRVRSDDTFDVKYEDGDVELRVAAADIERMETTPRSPPAKKAPKKQLSVGDVVKARYKKGKKLYQGKVTRVRSDGTYDIKYEDGDVETAVEMEYIEMPVQEEQDDDMIATFKVGDAVKARSKQGNKWYTAKIKRVRSDGTYDVEYEDGEVATGLDHTKLEQMLSVSPSKTKKSSGKSLQEGDRVQARYKGGKKLYPGAITRVRTDDTYDIKYDDGETELRVARDLIEVDEADAAFKVGDSVTAAYKGGKKLFKGKILRVRSNGTYDIEYEDGDVEQQVAGDKIQRAESSAKVLRVGDRVRAKHGKSKGRAVAGEITHVHSDGTVNITFDDGEKATYVERESVESESEIEPAIRVGDAVSARYKNGSKWFNGTVKRVRADGSMDIRYEDGDEEDRVKAENVRALETQKKTKVDGEKEEKQEEEERGSRKKDVVRVAKGDVVQVDYKGRGRYKQCEVVRVHRDGSMDVEFENGDIEKEVPAERVQSIASTKGSSRSKSERRKAASSDSDGDRKEKPKSKQRSSSSSSSSPTDRKKKGRGLDSAIAKGSRVTMRKAPDSRARRIGRVKKLHSDGSCDIEYSGGDVAKRIPVDALLLCSDSEWSGSEEERSTGKAKTAMTGRFKRDQQVVACWRRSSKMTRAKMTERWEDAVVLAVLDRGLYSIKYRTGEMEEDVPEEAIKSRDAEPAKAATSPQRYDREQSETDVVFLLEQLALTLYEEGAMRKKPRVRSIDDRSDTSSSSDSSSSSGSESDDDGKRSDGSADSSPKTKRKASKRGRPTSAIAKTLQRLFEPKLLTKYQELFNQRDPDGSGRISRSKLIDLVEQQFASSTSSTPSSPSSATAPVSAVRRCLSEWFETQDALRTHSKFSLDTFWLAFAVTKQHESKQRITQNVANVLDARFASHHEAKKQLELWQHKLGFRVFELLQRGFHDSAVPRLYPAQIRVQDVAMVLDHATRGAIPHKPLDLYLQQMRLLPHHTLHLPEFLCCYYQLYGSASTASSAPALIATEHLELRPLAFVASCLFSNGDVCCARHGDLVRRLSVGRTPAQVELILHFRHVFEALQEQQPPDNGGGDTIPTSKLDLFATRVTSGPSVLEQAVLALKKRTASVSLVELFASCGFIIDELTAAPTVANAIEKMKLRADTTDVRRIIGIVRGLCLKVLRFPNNSDYWRLRCDSQAFQQKIGRVDGATSLLEAVGFTEYGKSHFELRGARTLDGKKASCLTKHTLDTLRDKCTELDAELSVMDGVESILSILQRVAAERQSSSSPPLSLDECEQALRHLSVFIENVLKNPKDARCWRIRESNRTYQRQLGYLPCSADLMASIGYELVASSQGNVFVLRGTGLASSTASASSSDASLANFAFSSLSQQMEWFLWRRKQEIDSLLQDDMEYLVQALGHTATKAIGTSKQHAGAERMYPYGRNAMEVFNKSPAQKAQLQMIKAVFDSLDTRGQGYFLPNDLDKVLTAMSSKPRWAAFDAFDLDKDERVDLADFVGALGPALDHSFELLNSTALVPFERMTLSEQLSTLVGRLRLTAARVDVMAALDHVISSLTRVLEQPDNASVREIAAKSPLATHSSRLPVVKDLLHTSGYRVPSPPAAEVAFVLQPQGTANQVRFKTSTKGTGPSTGSSPSKSAVVLVPFNQQAISRLQLVASILAGHARLLLFPSISDVGAVARALAETRPIPQWTKLLELVSLCLQNILKNAADESRYRQIKTTTATFTNVVTSVTNGVALFLALGFRETDRGSLLLPDEITRADVMARKLELGVGCQALKTVEKLIAMEGEDDAARGDTGGLQGANAVEYYRRKALAADLAREEALRKSAHLEKQLEIVAKSQQDRRQMSTTRSAPTTPKARPKTASDSRAVTRPTTPTLSIEDEILASLSPRRQQTNVVETDRHPPKQRQGTNKAATTPTNQRQRHLGKSTQRRAPAAISSTIPALFETSLAMDSDVGSQTLVLRSTSAHVQSGALVRVGTDNRDLTEERVVMSLDTTTFPSMTRIALHRPLTFAHYARDLVFVLPAAAIDKLTRSSITEAWIRNDVVSLIIDTAIDLLSSVTPEKTPVLPHRSETTRGQLTQLMEMELHRNTVMSGGGVGGEQLVTYRASGTQSEVSIARDDITLNKLRAVWEGLVLEFGSEKKRDSVAWHHVQRVSRRVPLLAMSRGDQHDPSTKDTGVTWTAFLDWLKLPIQSGGGDVADDSGESTLALALLRAEFQSLQTKQLDAHGVFHIVSTDELVKRASARLIPLTNSPTETRDLAGVQQLFNRLLTLAKTSKLRQFSWPEVVYAVRYGHAITTPELFSQSVALPSPKQDNPTGVAAVVCGSISGLTIVLLLDGSIQVWGGVGGVECLSQCMALISPVQSASKIPASQGESFVEEHTAYVLKARSDTEWKQRMQHSISTSLDSFIQSTSQDRTLLSLSSSDSCLTVNATMLNSGGLLLFHVDAALGSVRPLRRVRPLPSTTTLKAEDSSRAGRRTAVSSAGPIESFVLCDTGVFAFITSVTKASAVVWLAAADSGEIISYVDCYAWLSDSRLVFCAVTTDDRTTVCVASTQAAFATVVEVAASGEKTTKTLVRQQRQQQLHCVSKSVGITSIASIAKAVAAAYSDGYIAVWQVDSESPGLLVAVVLQPTDVSIHQLLPLFVVGAKQPTPATSSSLCIADEEEQLLQRWDQELTATKCVRMALYLLLDGSVVDVAVPEAFSIHLVRLDDPTMRGATATEDDRVYLQPERVVRALLIAIEYRRDGVFAQKSVKELLADVVREQLLIKTHAEMQRFLDGYSDSLHITWRCYHRRGDSSESELVVPIPDSSSKPAVRSIAIGVAGCGTGKDKSKNRSTLLQLWSVSLSSSEADLHVIKQRSLLELEAHRIQRQRAIRSIESTTKKAAHSHDLIITQMREALGHLLSADVGHRGRERVAEALLSCLERLNAVWAQRSMDQVERAIIDRLFGSACSQHLGDILTKLRLCERVDHAFQPWLQRLRAHLETESPRRRSEQVDIHEVSLQLRRWRRDFLSIGLLVRIVDELGLLSHRTDTDLHAAIRQQYCAFALSRAEDSGDSSNRRRDPDRHYHRLLSFIHPRVAVEFILQLSDVGARLERSIDVLDERLQPTPPIATHATAPIEQLYAQLLLQRRLAARLQSVNQKLQLVHSQTADVPPPASLVAAAAMQKLRRLLKTALPSVAPHVASVTVRIPVTCDRVAGRMIARGYCQIDSERLPLSIIVCAGDSATQFQRETAFYRHVQQWKTRELFLPVIVSGFDAAIIGSDRLPIHPRTDPRTIVCESIDQWTPIKSCIRSLHESNHRSSLAHWQALVAFWCRHVLLAIVALEDEGLCLESLPLDDVIISPDCKSARIARLKLTPAMVDGQNVRVYGRFVAQLIQAMEKREKKKPVHQDFCCVHSELLDIWSSHSVRGDVSTLSSTATATELLRHVSDCAGSADVSLAAVMASALLALHPSESSRPTKAATLWALTMAETDDEVPDALATELSTVAAVDKAIYQRLLHALASIGTQELDALSAAVVLDAALDALQSVVLQLLQLPREETWACHTQQSLLCLLVDSGAVERCVVAAITVFHSCLQASQRDAAHRAIHRTQATLAAILRAVDSTASLTDLVESQRLQALVVHVVRAVCVLCGAPPTNPVPVRPAAITAALWRLGESSLRDLLAGSISYPRIHQLLASLVPSLAATVPLALSTESEKQASQCSPLPLWWRDRHAANSLPVCRAPLVLLPHTDGLLHVPLSSLRVLYDTLELRFNTSTAAVAAATKHRLAALQSCLSAAFIDRSSASPLAIAHDTTASVWLATDMAAFLHNFVRDPDTRIALATLSILEAYTRVLRLPPDKRLERHCFASSSPALRLALALCSSRQLFTAIASLLSDQVRALKVLGETGITNSSRYGVGAKTASPIALLATALALLANCLHAGSVSTHHWIATGLGSLLVAHARAKSLAFVRVADIATASDKWPVFLSAASLHGSASASPFSLLLQDLVLHTATRNLDLLQHLRATSSSFRQLVESFASPQQSAIDWLLAKAFATVDHAWDAVRDVDECDGTLDERAMAAAYAAYAVQRALTATRSTSQLPWQRLCATVFAWLRASWGSSSSDASRHGAVVVNALRLAHVIATAPGVPDAELLRLLRIEAEEDCGSVLSLVVQWIHDGVDGHTTGPTQVRMALELMVALVEAGPEQRARLLLRECIGLRSTVQLLQIDSAALAQSCCPGDSSGLCYVLQLKTRLWTAVLRLCGRDDVRWLINRKAVDHWLATLLACELPALEATSLDAIQTAIDRRLEAIAMLELLLRSLQLLGHRHSLPAQLWTAELINGVLHHRVIATERQLVLTAVRCQQSHVGSQQAALLSACHRLSATAKRVVQLVCCLAVDAATNETHAAVSKALTAGGVPSAIVRWHLRSPPEEDHDTDAAERVRDFWDAWPLESVAAQRSTPRSATVVHTPSTKHVAVVHTPSTRPPQRSTLVSPPSAKPRVQFTEEKPVAKAVGSRLLRSTRQAHERPPPPAPVAVPLDRLLACLDSEVAVLQAIFNRHASAVKNEKLMDGSRLPAALRECNVTSDKAVDAMAVPLSFSQFLQVYATQSGLAQQWLAVASDPASVAFVWLPTGVWTTVPSTQLQAVATAVRGSAATMAQAVDVLQRLHRGVFTRQELVELVKKALTTRPTRQHTAIDLDAIPVDELKRALAVVAVEAAKRPTVTKLRLPPASQSVDTPRLRPTVVPVSPVQLPCSRAQSNAVRESVVQTLLSIDMDSALALQQHEPRKKKNKAVGDLSLESDAYSPFSHEASSGSDSSSSQRAQRKRPSKAAKKKKRKKKKKKEAKRADSKATGSSSDESSSSSPSSPSSSSSSSSPPPPRRRQPATKTPRPTKDPPLTDALRQVFAKYDADGDGAISVADLRRVLGATSTPVLSTLELQRWIAEKDRRGVGAVDLADFAHAFATHRS